jgi:hypothetical protein
VQVREVTKDINEMRRYAENLEKVFKVLRWRELLGEGQGLLMRYYYCYYYS